MVEITHGGTWIKWSSLNRRDRNWAILSYVTALLASLPIGILTADWSYRLGFLLGSGSNEPQAGLDRLIASQAFAYTTLGSAVLAVISAVAWWQFSRNQDEMFNRIQNYAIAQAGGWTFAVAFVWWLVSLGGWLPPMSMSALVTLGVALLIAFWLHAVRRWL